MYFKKQRLSTETIYTHSKSLTFRKKYVQHSVLKLQKTMPIDIINLQNKEDWFGASRSQNQNSILRVQNLTNKQFSFITKSIIKKKYQNDIF